MLPLIPFIAGAVAGITATELWRRGKVQGAAQAASDKLRASAASGLQTVRETGASLRETVVDALHDKWHAMRGGKEADEAIRELADAGEAMPDLFAEDADQAKAVAQAPARKPARARKPQAATKATAKTASQSAAKPATKPSAKPAPSGAKPAAAEPGKPAHRRPARKKTGAAGDANAPTANRAAE